MVHKNSKLQFWSSNEDNLWLGVNITRGAVLKGHRVKRLRTTVCHTHRFFGCTFFLSAGLLTDVNYILVKQLTQKKNLQQQREAKVRKKKSKEEGSWGRRMINCWDYTVETNVSKTETEWLKKGKKNKKRDSPGSSLKIRQKHQIWRKYSYLEGIVSDSQAKNNFRCSIDSVGL